MPTPKGKSPGSPGPAKRISGAPRRVGPAWSLSEHEQGRFDRIYGVTSMLEKLPPTHDQDRGLYFKGVAAALGFHELSNAIDQLERDGNHDELQADLEMVRVGFELALQALDQALGERAAHLGRARDAALTRVARDPRAAAMAEIKRIWEQMEAGEIPYMKDAELARKMAPLHPVLTNEGSIKNAIARWRAEKSSS